MKPAEKLDIQCAAVLGAGVMGAQIAAHLTNAGVKTILFDLPSEKGDQNTIAEEALKALKKLKPSPLGVEGIEQFILPANYSKDLEKLKQCNLVIEAIAEKFEFKKNLYQKILPFLSPLAIFATNTSGLSIQKLAEILPENRRNRFCGVHFFNPPRYMKLVELIPNAQTDKSLLIQLESFLVARLGKGVIHAKDTPNFIGNRIGVFSLLSCLYHSKTLGLPPDIVDALTGTLIGRPKSATFRTMDIVGLDTLKHVVNTFKQELSMDPWADPYFDLPDWIEKLIDQGALGQKKQAGVYKKVGSQIQVYDTHDQCYRPVSTHLDENIITFLKQKDWPHRFQKLRQSNTKEAQFIWRIFRDLFHYASYHLKTIAHTVRDVDLAIRWGYGWELGPFEIWQLGNWQEIIQAIEDEMQEMPVKVALPPWVREVSPLDPYSNGKSYSVELGTFETHSDLPVYQRQFFPDRVLTEQPDEGETIFETESVRMWTLQDDKFPILSFKTKKNCIGSGVLEGIQEAIARAEKDYEALILWQRQSSDFSVGANLKEVLEKGGTNPSDIVEKMVTQFQKVALALRYANVPTIAAIRGLTLGGGCELAMHATRIVAAFETYIGLVEVGVGLLPAGGGTKELAYRAAQKASNGDLFKLLKIYFEQIAFGKISNSALDAKQLNYLQPQDKIIFNTDELLYAAKKQAAFLADVGYFPPFSQKFPVAGKPGIANFKAQLVNLREGEFISDHDYLIGTKIAHVLCGGEVEMGTLVNEDWMLNLEKEGIMALAQTNLTLARIQYMLEKGQPLRN